jgi:hypothetical protein
MACSRLRERSSIRQERWHAVPAARRVVAVDEVAERIQAGVLSEGQPERKAAGLDRNPAADAVEDHAERRAVQRMKGEPRRTPMPAARHRLAQQRDVRVVAVEDALVDRLEKPPDGRRG